MKKLGEVYKLVEKLRVGSISIPNTQCILLSNIVCSVPFDTAHVTSEGTCECPIIRFDTVFLNSTY